MLKKFSELTGTTKEFMDLIKIEKAESIGKIVLNSPETLNIIEKETFQEIHTALDEFEDSDIKIALISAVCGVSRSGKKVFSAGVNLKNYDEKIKLAKTDPDRFKEELRSARGLIERIERLNKPVVIAIDGFVTGGFFELALGCDVILASKSAAFSLNEVNIGIIPGYGGIHRLLRLVGKNRTFEIIAAGRKIDAREAYELGIVTKILDNDAQVTEYCQKLAAQPSSSLCLVKDTMQRISAGENPEEVELENFLKAVTSQEAETKIKAFLTKH